MISLPGRWSCRLNTGEHLFRALTALGSPQYAASVSAESSGTALGSPYQASVFR